MIALQLVTIYNIYGIHMNGTFLTISDFTNDTQENDGLSLKVICYHL